MTWTTACFLTRLNCSVEPLKTRALFTRATTTTNGQRIIPPFFLRNRTIPGNWRSVFLSSQFGAKFCSVTESDSDIGESSEHDPDEELGSGRKSNGKKSTKKGKRKRLDFSKVDIHLLPTVILVGRPNVGKSALFNRSGLQPLDFEVGKWLRKNAPGIRTILAMNKSESLDDRGLLTSEGAEAHALGFGDPIAISAETGPGMTELYEILRPLLEEYLLQIPATQIVKTEDCLDPLEAKLPLQLAIVGRPNVGKSTLLNVLLQEERVLVGPESGLTRDSIGAQFKFDNRTIYLVDTAGWLQRSGQERGSASLSIMQSRKKSYEGSCCCFGS